MHFQPKEHGKTSSHYGSEMSNLFKSGGLIVKRRYHSGLEEYCLRNYLISLKVRKFRSIFLAFNEILHAIKRCTSSPKSLVKRRRTMDQKCEFYSKQIGYCKKTVSFHHSTMYNAFGDDFGYEFVGSN